jgi:hypothetical protein
MAVRGRGTCHGQTVFSSSSKRPDAPHTTHPPGKGPENKNSTKMVDIFRTGSNHHLTTTRFQPLMASVAKMSTLRA